MVLPIKKQNPCGSAFCLHPTNRTCRDTKYRASSKAKPTSQKKLIRIKNVKKTYKTGTTDIYDLDLNIKKGEFVFIIGSTGCGKSTLIKMLYREEKPTSGEINIGGVDVGKLRNRNVYKIRRKIGGQWHVVL